MLDNAVPMYVQGGKKKINNAMLTDLQIYVETQFKYLWMTNWIFPCFIDRRKVWRVQPAEVWAISHVMYLMATIFILFACQQTLS